MRKITAIILLALCALLTMSACNGTADTVETMVSTMLATDATNNMNDDQNNGTVTDGDGIIGNENEQNTQTNSSNTDNTDTTTVSGNSANDNVL